MDKPSITVVTAVYNAAKYLRNTVESVAKQTLLPNEHLLIDDCSTDDSLALAYQLEREFQHVRVIRHDQNKGFPSALNTGIAASDSHYIGILDSDDIALPYWLETVIPVLEANPQVAAAGGGCVIMTKDGVVTGYVKYCNKKGDVTSGTRDAGEYPFLHPGTVHRRKFIEQIGGYNPRLKSLEDNDVFLGLSSIARLIHVGIPLIYYRRLPGSESKKTDEFKSFAILYLTAKRELLKSGCTVAEANLQLVSQVNDLQSVKRLAPINKGEYEFEMACAFETGKKNYQALKQYFGAGCLGYMPELAMRGVVRCITPKQILNLWRHVRLRFSN